MPTAMTPISIGPFRVRGGVKNTFTLVTSPDPAPLGGSDPRVASIYVNQPVFRPMLNTAPDTRKRIGTRRPPGYNHAL